MDSLKVLLDTDIGTDIDDAVCLAYLLSNPDCNLLGITTVTGEAEVRAMLASSVCKAAGREIPIYPGTEQPLLLPQRQLHAAQAEALTNWPHASHFPKGEAIEFLRRTIRSNPGEVTLITIAPLTNIALLFSIDPEIPRLLKGLVMMCGRFLELIPEGYGPLEWNAQVDAHATSIVYRAPVPIHRSIGLDVTSKVVMQADTFRKTFQGIPVFGPVLDYAEVWFRDWQSTTFHDPLAAATVFNPDLCSFQRGSIDVALNPGTYQGFTRWIPEESGPHQIASNVDAEAFFRNFCDVVHAGSYA
ncbi:MAG TPA: nucleoside hydrolase [Bacteroidota bacterium]